MHTDAFFPKLRGCGRAVRRAERMRKQIANGRYDTRFATAYRRAAREAQRAITEE